MRRWAGGWWPEARRHQAFGVPEICYRCGRTGSEAHHLWECPHLAIMQHPDVASTAHQAIEFRDVQGLPPAKWSRGFFLEPEVAVPPPADTQETWQFGDPTHPDMSEAVVCMDGSGGSNTSDPRARRCGWGFGFFHPTTYQAIAGQLGTLAGKQTVPGTEIQAGIMLHSYMRAHGIPRAPVCGILRS